MTRACEGSGFRIGLRQRQPHLGVVGEPLLGLGLQQPDALDDLDGVLAVDGVPGPLLHGLELVDQVARRVHGAQVPAVGTHGPQLEVRVAVALVRRPGVRPTVVERRGPRFLHGLAEALAREHAAVEPAGELGRLTVVDRPSGGHDGRHPGPQQLEGQAGGQVGVVRTVLGRVGLRVDAADVAAVEEDQIGGDQALPELHRAEDLVGADDDAVAQRVLGLGVEAPVPGDVDDAVVLPEELVEQPGRLSLDRAPVVLVDARVHDEVGLVGARRRRGWPPGGPRGGGADRWEGPR